MAKASELREHSVEQLRQQLRETREELFRLRFQQATHQLENSSQLRSVRRNVARILTLLTEKQAPDAPEAAANNDNAGEKRD